MPGLIGRMTFDGRPDVMILTCTYLEVLSKMVQSHERVNQDLMPRLSAIQLQATEDAYTHARRLEPFSGNGWRCDDTTRCSIVHWSARFGPQHQAWG